MKDNLSIVITIIVLVLLMVLFPLYNFFERQNEFQILFCSSLPDYLI